MIHLDRGVTAGDSPLGSVLTPPRCLPTWEGRCPRLCLGCPIRPAGRRGEVPECDFQVSCTRQPPAPLGTALGALWTAEGTGGGCLVLGGRTAFEGQRATACGHSDLLETACEAWAPTSAPRPWRLARSQGHSPWLRGPKCAADELDLECDHLPARSDKRQPGAWGSVGMGSGAPCPPAGS